MTKKIGTKTKKPLDQTQIFDYYSLNGKNAIY